MTASDKLEEARGLLKDLFTDIDDVLSLAEMTIPMVGATVEKAKLRISQVERLFGVEEETKA
jgi:hypothetical protein